MSIDDNKFLEGINQKRANAWKELYNSFYGALCNYSRGIIGNEGNEEDLVQECLISIWKSELYFQDIKALSTYLYRSVHNNSLKFLRDRQVIKKRMNDYFQDNITEETDLYSAIEEEMIRKLRNVIAELPEQRRKILLMSLEGNTMQRISEVLNISINTVKTQKKRAYALLKERLKKDLSIILTLYLRKNQNYICSNIL